MILVQGWKLFGLEYEIGVIARKNGKVGRFNIESPLFGRSGERHIQTAMEGDSGKRMIRVIEVTERGAENELIADAENKDWCECLPED